jgi:hypothetical protein
VSMFVLASRERRNINISRRPFSSVSFVSPAAVIFIPAR